ncbi:MAG: hypothetical protein AAF467_04030 [Actinomycetota bacterium]
MTRRFVFTRALAAAAAFMVIQAVLAAIWRRALLPDVYEGRGFYDFTEPTLLLVLGGLASYFLTGLIVAMLYGHLKAVALGGFSTARFLFLMGALYWVLHDFSYIGRQEMDGPALYLLLEAVLAAAIFGLFSQVLPRLFSQPPTTPATPMSTAASPTS